MTFKKNNMDRSIDCAVDHIRAQYIPGLYVYVRVVYTWFVYVPNLCVPGAPLVVGRAGDQTSGAEGSPENPSCDF